MYLSTTSTSTTSSFFFRLPSLPRNIILSSPFPLTLHLFFLASSLPLPPPSLLPTYHFPE